MNSAILDPAAPRRWRLDDHGSEYIITIPRKWSWMTFAWEPLFACVLIYLFPQMRQEALQSKFVFGFFLLAALGLLKGWLWNIGGREIVVITTEELRLRRELFGIGPQRKFTLKRVSDLTFQEAQGGEDSRKSGIYFNYSGSLNPFQQRRFGDDLSRNEADELINAITTRFPQLDQCTPDTGHFITLGLNSK